MEPVRILQVVAELDMGGIQNFLMNVYRNIDRDNIQFDFLLNMDKKGVFEEEIEELGGRVYRVTSRNVSLIKNRIELEHFFQEHKEYKCIHCHFSNLSYLMPLKMAFKYKIPTRILHSHSTHLPSNPIHKIIHEYNRRIIDKIATDFYACSDLAGKWLFEGTEGYSKQVIIKNGIQTNKYVFNTQVRKVYREKLGLDNNIVIGNVGRLSEPKNHPFLLDVFSELKQLNQNVVLVIVGDGPDRDLVKQRIEELGVGDSVIMLGMRQDVSSILQAFDCFLMPSKWEGFPVALLEAEAAGLPAYVSDTVTTQAQINNNISYLSLELGARKWAEIIHEQLSNWNRLENADKIVEAGFDINSTVKYLTSKYLGASSNDKDTSGKI